MFHVYFVLIIVRAEYYEFLTILKLCLIWLNFSFTLVNQLNFKIFFYPLLCMGDPPAGDSVSGGYKSDGESVSAQYGENVSGIVLFMNLLMK